MILLFNSQEFILMHLEVMLWFDIKHRIFPLLAIGAYFLSFVFLCFEEIDIFPWTPSVSELEIPLLTAQGPDMMGFHFARKKKKNNTQHLKEGSWAKYWVSKKGTGRVIGKGCNTSVDGFFLEKAKKISSSSPQP